jgi:hypothetical protein
MGSGQSAANVMTGAAGQRGQNEASNLYNAGQARASGYIGQANALNKRAGPDWRDCFLVYLSKTQ